VAFEAFDQVRRPRAQKLVATSRAAGLVYGFSDQSISDDLEKLQRDIETRWTWIWNLDLARELDRAKQLVRESHVVDGHK